MNSDAFDRIRDHQQAALESARLAFGKTIAEAFIAERDASGRTTPPPPAPRTPHLNRRERRRLAALARKQ